MTNIDRIYDTIIRFVGTPWSIGSIFFVTIGLVVYGTLTCKSPAGYWEKTNLFFSVLAIFEAEIILMGSKRRDEKDAVREQQEYNAIMRIQEAVKDEPRN